MATIIFNKMADSSRTCLLLLLTILVVGCDVEDIAGKHLGQRSFHQKFDWKAAEFFEDPQVVALCEAIEADDLPEMDRLIAAGADVNARGAGNMTPLMWAFPDNKLPRFQKLLEHGADPNVKITSDLGVPSGFAVGDSVTTEAAQTHFPGYFQAVMQAGGDANIRNGHGRSPIQIIILAMVPDAKERCEVALQHGADINALAGDLTPPMAAVATAGQYDLALYFLEQGADHTLCMENKVQKLIHMVVSREANVNHLLPEQRADQQRLLKWLVAHGEDADTARADWARWTNFSPIPSEHAKQWRAEVAAKERREAAK